MALARTPPLLDTERAQISADAGGILIDDPDAPWLVWVRVEPIQGVDAIVELRLLARPDRPAITAGALARLPVAHLRHAAAAAGHPNEAYYRMLARPKAPGGHRWPADHWSRVLQIYQWAADTKRPGGPLQAVADMWGVAVRPTVRRWLKRARHTEANDPTIPEPVHTISP